MIRRRGRASYRGPVLAWSLDTVRTAAVIAVIAFAVAAIGAAILMKSLAQKAAMALIFLLLATLVWTQRASLEDCASVVRSSVTTESEARCTFFGRDVTVTPGRD